MAYKALVQIALIALSVLLIVVYIRPTFEEIGGLQDELYEYQAAVSNVQEFNKVLSELSQVINSYSVRDREALEMFLPASIDLAQVMRDLEVILSERDIIIQTMSAAEGVTSDRASLVEGVDQDGLGLVYDDINLVVYGTYTDIKNMLAIIEASAQPMEVVSMVLNLVQAESESFAAVADEDMPFQAEITLRIHSLPTI